MSEPFTPQSLSVLAIGNAIVDILSFVEDAVIARHNLAKTGMKLCSSSDQNALLADITPSASSPGGSAANSIYSLAVLGTSSGFLGTVSDDYWGNFFLHSFNDAGVTSLLEFVDDPTLETGTSVILITPDSERTMNTHLGAAGAISLSTLNEEAIAEASIFYIEGYTYDEENEKQAVIAATEIAHHAGNKVALTLSDQGCVDRHHQSFIELIKQADIVFANESELCRLFEIDDQTLSHEIIDRYIHLCAPLTVITQSERGCTVVDGSTIFSVPAQKPKNLLDLTGAGDQFAAGFLYGLVNNYTLTDSARFGIELATQVISTVGPRIDVNDLLSIRNNFLPIV